MTRTVTVLWHCGMAIGPPKWQGTEAYESDECNGEGQFEVPYEEWIKGDMEFIDCTECGQFLEDTCHYDPEPPRELGAWNHVAGPDEF